MCRMCSHSVPPIVTNLGLFKNLYSTLLLRYPESRVCYVEVTQIGSYWRGPKSRVDVNPLKKIFQFINTERGAPRLT